VLLMLVVLVLRVHLLLHLLAALIVVEARARTLTADPPVTMHPFHSGCAHPSQRQAMLCD
jgi:hypothetical protein